MKPNLTKAILGGFVGTLALTFMMYKVAPMMGVNMDIAGRLGQMLGGRAMGMVMHFVNGTVIFPLIYVFLLYRFLPGPPVVKGMVWGMVLWLTTQLMLMPIMGAGFFSMKAGGMRAAIASLVGHLMYGALLGSIAGAGVEERPVRAAA